MDIYDDLDNFEKVVYGEQLMEENNQLKRKLEESTAALNKLKQDFDKLSMKHQQLLTNYTALLKTAKAEVERKTQTIVQMNIEKDELFLKLANSRFNRKVPMSQKNNCNDAIKNLKIPKKSFEKEDTTDPNNCKEKCSESVPEKCRTRGQKKAVKQIHCAPEESVSELKECPKGKENHDSRTHTPEIQSSERDRHDSTTITSDKEEGEIADSSIDLRSKINKLKSRESTSSHSSHTKDSDVTRESRSRHRDKAYDSNRDTRDRFYKHKDKVREREDFSRQRRSTAPERDFSGNSKYQRGRSRHREPDNTSKDRYPRDKSRGQRSYNKPDNYHEYTEKRPTPYTHERIQEQFSHDRASLKHKRGDIDNNEPMIKRRRQSTYDGPGDVRTRLDSEPNYEEMEAAYSEDKMAAAYSEDKMAAAYSEDKMAAAYSEDKMAAAYSEDKMTAAQCGPVQGFHTSVVGERLQMMSCQSPDDVLADRNALPQPIKCIVGTATTNLEDPRLFSRRYLKILKNDVPNLIAAKGNNVELKVLAPYVDEPPRPADEEKVQEIYADIDKMITHMSTESNNSKTQNENASGDSDLYDMPYQNVASTAKSIQDAKPNILPDITKLTDKNVIKASKPGTTYSPLQRLFNHLKTEESNALKLENESKNLEKSKKDQSIVTGSKDNITTQDKVVHGITTLSTAIPNVDIKNCPEVSRELPESYKKFKITKKRKKDLKTNETIDVVEKPVQNSNPLQVILQHLRPNSKINDSNLTEVSKYIPTNTESHAVSGKGIVEGDLELSDETSDYTQFSEKCDTSNKLEIDKKEKPKTDDNAKKKKFTKIEKSPEKRNIGIKAKFSDLFGDTSSSLITPEDLELPRAVTTNYPCLPSVESTNEPWSLQDSPKPCDTEPTPSVVVAKTQKDDVIKPKKNPTPILMSNAEVINKDIVMKTPNETTPEAQTELSSKGMTRNGCEGLLNDFYMPVKALATSTPMRTYTVPLQLPENTQHSEKPVQSPVIPERPPERPLSIIQEETSNVSKEGKELSESESSTSNIMVPNDTPDVRIIVKRRKRVVKK